MSYEILLLFLMYLIWPNKEIIVNTAKEICYIWPIICNPQNIAYCMRSTNHTTILSVARCFIWHTTLNCPSYFTYWHSSKLLFLFHLFYDISWKKKKAGGDVGGNTVHDICFKNKTNKYILTIISQKLTGYGNNIMIYNEQQIYLNNMEQWKQLALVFLHHKFLKVILHNFSVFFLLFSKFIITCWILFISNKFYSF